MTGIRRTLLLAALTVAVFLGTPAAAQAAFSDSITTPPATISTATVAGPTDVTARQINCGSNARWQDVSLSWAASPTAGVSGYRVTVYRTNGSVVDTATVGAGATAVVIQTDKFSVSTRDFTVTTLTGYGWSKESPKVQGVAC